MDKKEKEINFEECYAKDENGNYITEVINGMTFNLVSAEDKGKNDSKKNQYKEVIICNTTLPTVKKIRAGST